jgi:colanic acid/amylovoran biosynthesis glycosyltransferase
MPTIAYLANQFPSPVEPYVAEEIPELRRRGVTVIPCSVRHQRAALDPELTNLAAETLYLQPLQVKLLISAAFTCLLKFALLKDFFYRVLQGNETFSRRLHALLHTWLGVYYALLLKRSNIDHIHVHHGYFSSWIGMVAARVLGIEFSMTLHGSDLLLHPAYLDTKLRHCAFCVTISDSNRKHILQTYPDAHPENVFVRRMGVDPLTNRPARKVGRDPSNFSILAVGRLHPVKDHAFLIRACGVLKNRGMPFACAIAGDGRERESLEMLIRDLNLGSEIRLVGHLARQDLEPYYAAADLVVLTSRSEGIPLVLMEAMARGKLVLAPAITGIPELVLDGINGFLYRPGSLEDFMAHIECVYRSEFALGTIGEAARQQVIQNFNRDKNLAAFCNLLITRISDKPVSRPVRSLYENPVLQ